jgi:hypothetical protein
MHHHKLLSNDCQSDQMKLGSDGVVCIMNNCLNDAIGNEDVMCTVNVDNVDVSWSPNQEADSDVTDVDLNIKSNWMSDITRTER